MTDTTRSTGCVVLLIDESAAMESPIQEDVPGLAPGQRAKSRADSVATAVNSLLKRLTDGPDVGVALVGYRTGAGDEVDVGPRWGGGLGGRDFVRASELAAAPMRVEDRTRKSPNPAGFGPPVEQRVSFPVWYEPTTGGRSPQVAAFEYVGRLLDEWRQSAGPDARPPVVVHIFSGGSANGNPHQAVQEILGQSWNGGAPLVLQIHLSTSKTVPAMLYPSNRFYLAPGPMKDLFGRSSPLPAGLLAALREQKVAVNAGAVGMLYNARMADVARALRLVEVWTRGVPQEAASAAAAPARKGPPAVANPVAPRFGAPGSISPRPGVPAPPPLGLAEVAPPVGPETESPVREQEALAPPLETIPLAPDDEDAIRLAVPESDRLNLSLGDDAPLVDAAPAGEKAALLVLVLDRSVRDPYGGDTQNACAKLQERANEILAGLAKKPTDRVDVALVSYGTDYAGETEVRTQFEGPLAGEIVVRDSRLAGAALRVDEVETQVPNGVGGLMTVPLKKPVYVEVEPTAAADPRPAFAAAARVMAEWSARHPTAVAPPILLHLTRGELDPAATSEALGHISAPSAAGGPALVYHLVATEIPHRSVAYPSGPQDLETESLQGLLEMTSPLLGRDRLATERPTIVSADSRGMVVNGKFDLLLEGVHAALA